MFHCVIMCVWLWSAEGFSGWMDNQAKPVFSFSALQPAISFHNFILCQPSTSLLSPFFACFSYCNTKVKERKKEKEWREMLNSTNSTTRLFLSQISQFISESGSLKQLSLSAPPFRKSLSSTPSRPLSRSSPSSPKMLS